MYLLDVICETLGAEIAAGFFELRIVGWTFTSANSTGY